MGDISKGVTNILQPAKKYTKKNHRITTFRHGIKQESAHLLATAVLWVRKQTSLKNTKWAT
jgi:hypothetical protein